MMTNRELQDLLKQCPDDMPVYIDTGFLDELIECTGFEFDDEYQCIVLD